MKTILIALFAGSLAAGCVHVAAEPALDFPAFPELTFQCARGHCCLTEDETNDLNRWAKKLHEFEAARERLLKD